MSVRKAVFCSHREILLFLSPCFLWCTTGLCFGSYSAFIALAADFQEVCWWHPNLFGCHQTLKWWLLPFLLSLHPARPLHTCESAASSSSAFINSESVQLLFGISHRSVLWAVSSHCCFIICSVSRKSCSSLRHTHIHSCISVMNNKLHPSFNSLSWNALAEDTLSVNADIALMINNLSLLLCIDMAMS